MVEPFTPEVAIRTFQQNLERRRRTDFSESGWILWVEVHYILGLGKSLEELGTNSQELQKFIADDYGRRIDAIRRGQSQNWIDLSTVLERFLDRKEYPQNTIIFGDSNDAFLQMMGTSVPELMQLLHVFDTEGILTSKT